MGSGTHRGLHNDSQNTVGMWVWKSSLLEPRLHGRGRHLLDAGYLPCQKLPEVASLLLGTPETQIR